MSIFGRAPKNDDSFRFLLQKPGDEKWCISSRILDDILPIDDGSTACRLVFKRDEDDNDFNGAARRRCPESYDLSLSYWDLLDMMAERANKDHAPFLDLCDYCLPDAQPEPRTAPKRASRP